MFKLFISKESLTDLFIDHAEDRSEWLKVIQNQRKLFLMNKQIDIETDLANPNSMLFMYLTASGKTSDFLDPAPLSLSEIQSDHSRVLEHPCGVFLLDITENEANKIQDDYGEICRSTRNLNTCPLTSFNHRRPDVGEKNYDWVQLFSPLSIVPSNSLILIDRNLFSNNSGDINLGIQNVRDILDALLPHHKMLCDYHVAIIIGSENGRINSKLSLEDLSKKLNITKSELGREYSIIMSLLVVDEGDKVVYAVTHNRRIITNYLICSVDNGLAAFRSGESRYEQNIYIDSLFSGDLTGKSDTPLKSHKQKIDKLKEEVLDYCKWKANPNNRFASGMNISAQIEKLNHRLLKSPPQQSCTLNL